MNFKKTISAMAALAVSVSAFAGFAVTANAAGELSGSYSTATKTFSWVTGEASGEGTYSTTDDDKYADLTIVSKNDWNNMSPQKGLYLFRPSVNGQNTTKIGYITITPTVDGIFSFDVDVAWTSGNSYRTDIYMQEATSEEEINIENGNIVVSSQPVQSETKTVKFSAELSAAKTYYIYSFQYYSQRNATNFYNFKYETNELVMDEIAAPEYSSPANAINVNKYSEGGLLETGVGTFDFTNQINTMDKAVSATNIDFYLTSTESNITFSFDSSKSGSNVTGTSVKVSPNGVTYVFGGNDDQTITENVSFNTNTWYRMTVKIANRTSPMSVQISDITSGESKFSNDNIVLRNASDILYRRVNISFNGLSYIANVQVYNSEITYKYMVDGLTYEQVKAVEGLAPTAPSDPEKDGFIFKGWQVDEEDPTVFNAIFEEETIPEPELPTGTVTRIATSTDLEGNPAASYMAAFSSENTFDVSGITWTVTNASNAGQSVNAADTFDEPVTVTSSGSIVFGLVIEAPNGIETIGNVTAVLK